MTREELLKKEILSKYKSLRQFAKEVGIAPSTLTTILNSGVGGTSIDTILLICEKLNLDINIFKETENQVLPRIMSKEYEHIEKYRLLDEHGKQVIDNILELELNRVQQENAPKSAERHYTYESSREIAIYDIPVSAGTGIFLDSSNYEVIDASDAPINASFAVRVSGDSMEPMFYDGDIVYIKQQPVIESGEIGVFMLDGNGYMKKFIRRDDKCFLVSLNPKYDDIELTEYSEFRVYGKVLGKKAK